MKFLTEIASAQGTFSKVAQNPGVVTVVNKIMSAIVIPILQAFFVLTLLIFFWGILGMIWNGGDSDARATGQRHMLWGAVGLFIMTSAYGIIRLIANTIGVADPFL